MLLEQRDEEALLRPRGTNQQDRRTRALLQPGVQLPVFLKLLPGNDREHSSACQPIEQFLAVIGRPFPAVGAGAERDGAHTVFENEPLQFRGGRKLPRLMRQDIPDREQMRMWFQPAAELEV